MIVQVRGRLLEKGAESAVVEAGGLGYELFMAGPALAALPEPGQEVRLYTHLHIREDAQTLYGFAAADERGIFLLLMTVKGVGPKVALGMLSVLSPGDLVRALAERDLASLTRVSGVGKKLAERLGVELSDKAKGLAAGLAAGFAAGAPGPGGGGQGARRLQAQAALTALGYSQNQARQAVDEALRVPGVGEAAVEELVKEALKVV